MKAVCFKNAPMEQVPTIVIGVNDPEYAEAHSRWIAGKTPTDSPEWKRGVYLRYV